MKHLIVIIAAMAFAASAQAECYSEGVRIGDLQKFSQKGMFTKSWEGEIVLEGFKIRGNENGTKGGNVWAFSVTDPAVASQINAAVMDGGRVALKYCQVNPLDITRGLSISTSYIVTQVKVQTKQQ